MDFFHLCEAPRVCATDDPKVWLEEPKARLEANRLETVLEALSAFVETDGDGPPQNPHG